MRDRRNKTDEADPRGEGDELDREVAPGQNAVAVAAPSASAVSTERATVPNGSP